MTSPGITPYLSPFDVGARVFFVDPDTGIDEEIEGTITHINEHDELYVVWDDETEDWYTDIDLVFTTPQCECGNLIRLCHPDA